MSDYQKSLLYCVLFSFFVATLAVYDLRLSLIEAEHRARDRVANTSFMISEWIKGAFTASDYVLRDIVTTVPISELKYPATDQKSFANISQYIDDKRKTLPNATGVGLNDGNCIMTHTLTIIGFDASDREWCSVPMNNPEIDTYVSNMFRSNSGELMVIQARRFPGEGSFNGLAGIGVDLDFFSKWLDQVSISPHGILAISDQNISLLARKPSLPSALGKEVNDPIFKAFFDSGLSYATYRVISPLDGMPRLYGLRQVEDLPFVVVVGEADQDWKVDWVRRAFAAGFAVIILWLMAALTLRYDWYRLDSLKEIKKTRDALAKLSVTDGLTGLANRRRFDEVLFAEYRRMQRMKAPLSIIMLDIDSFKAFNDTYGHIKGDECIRAIAAIIKKTMKRPQDLAARFGGEEFICILPDTNHASAMLVATAIKDNIAAERIPHVSSRVVNHVTISAGVATVICDGTMTPYQLVNIADERLYQAKDSGRNRVC